MDKDALQELAEEAGWQMKEEGTRLNFLPGDGRSLSIDRPEDPKAVPLPPSVQKRVEKLRLDPLRVDHSYQRDLDEGWLAYLMEHWDPLHSGILTISQRGDRSMWVVDGQHRREVMQRKGMASADCEVYTGLTLPMEAELFDRLNTRKTVHPLMRFRARVRALDPTALWIERTLLELGTKVAWSTDQGYPCIVALEKAYRQGTLQDVIEILEASWPHEDIRHTPVVVRAMSYFRLNYVGDGFRMDRAINRFEAAPLKPMVIGARGDAAGTDKSQAWWLAGKFKKVYARKAR